MKTERFKGTVLSGHKQAAVELPFDPAECWQSPAVPLWPGRRGHPVGGFLNGTPFESAVVSRSKKNWLLIEDQLRERLGIAIGDTVAVSLLPRKASTP